MSANAGSKASTAPPARGLWRRAFYVGGAVTALNNGLYLTGYLLGILPGLRPLHSDTALPGMAAVTAISLFATFAATAFYRVLEFRMRRPMRGFLMMATPLFVLSFLAPTAMGNWSRAQVALFELMHIAVATAVATALWDWQKQKRSVDIEKPEVNR
jgi:hypothetical protein